MSKLILGMSTYNGPTYIDSLEVVSLNLVIEGVLYNLDLKLSTSSGYKKFRMASWTVISSISDRTQREAYVSAFNRDFSAIGGAGNLNAKVVGDNIEITATKGRFVDGEYLGDILQSVTFTYDNDEEVVPKTLYYSKTGVGDCSTEEYKLSAATGGTAPYRLTFGGDTVVAGWDGDSDEIFTLNRADVYSGALYDSAGEVIKEVSINPTKKIVASDFKERTTPYSGYSDILIDTVKAREGTTPLEYNLVDSDGNETGWQDSNIFGGVLPGTYTTKIRDRYQCEVSRTFLVREVEVEEPEEGEDVIRTPYIKASEYNSLSFFNEVKSDSVRRNYNNTPSWQERVALPKNGVFEFPSDLQIPTQFRSSFPYHRVTLFRKGSTPIPIQIFEIQTNLGVVERVDCKLRYVFDTYEQADGTEVVSWTKTAVYFEGGNQYEPNSNTTMADPDSPYNGSLPGWAQVGNSVAIEGKGTFTILETDLYDEDRDVLYFTIEAKFPNQDAIIQSSYDRHAYNIFRFSVDMELVPEKGAFVRIEPGVMSGTDFLVDTTRILRSEWLTPLRSTNNYLHFKWYAYRNIGYMSFTDGIECHMWLRGRMRPFSATSADTEDADDRTNSVDQESHLRMRASLPVLTPRKWRKLDLIGAIGDRGSVFVEDMEVVRISSSEQEELGTSNLSSYSVDLAFAAEPTSISQEDPIYSVDTGLTVAPGSEPGTGKEPVVGWELEGNERRLVTEDGEFVKTIGSDGVERYVVIP